MIHDSKGVWTLRVESRRSRAESLAVSPALLNHIPDPAVLLLIN